MSNLVKTSELPALNVRLNNADPRPFKLFLNQEILKLYLKNGQNNPDPAEVQAIRNELYDHLMETWPGVRAEWVKEAFKKGIAGKYGEFANISFRIMVSWVNTFRAQMRAGDYGVEKESEPLHVQAAAILTEIRKRNPDIVKLDKRGKEALKKKKNDNR